MSLFFGNINLTLSKLNIALILIIIGSVSLFFKLYTTEFSLPFTFDNLGYTLDAIQYSQGDFFVTPKKNPGWPLLISPFMLLLDSDNFLDYNNLVRTISLGIGTFTIFPMYILARKFFNEKYSVVAAALFAFEPHLNYIAGQGMSEPLFILMFISSIYFVLNKNPRKSLISFIFAGFFWCVRIEGFYLFFILTIIFFLNYRRNSKLVLYYVACVAVFLIVVSPVLSQRYEQYGNPFFIWWNETIFSESYSVILTSPQGKSPFDYIDKHGPLSFFDRFILTGIDNMINQLARITYPFLFILLPFGILFSFRAFDQNRLYMRANWIVILLTLAVLVIPFATVGDRRYLFPIFPFLIIFATIPIQRVTEYGLSTFSFSQKKKNVFIIVVISLVVLLSATFTFGYGGIGYGKLDLQKEHEKIEFARILVNTLKGRMIDGYETMEYVTLLQISESQIFKNYQRNIGKNPYLPPDDPNILVRINIHADLIEELILKGENLNLKYISIDEEGAYFLPFLNHVYENEERYPYLIKILDSHKLGFDRYEVKVFEINYTKFHELNK